MHHIIYLAHLSLLHAIAIKIFDTGHTHSESYRYVFFSILPLYLHTNTDLLFRTGY